MAIIKVHNGTAYVNIEVTEELAVAYAEMERQERLTERKETRRHQSLDKSLENGFDVADPSENIVDKIEISERNRQLYQAIETLTDKQRFVFLSHILDEQPFRVIGESLGLGTYTVRDYYYNAVKKLKKYLSYHTPK